jgi:hypothetical protein
MVGEQFAAGVLKAALGLTEEDIGVFQQYIQQLKCEGPMLIKRAELSERRTLIIARTLEKVFPKEFEAAKNETIEQYKAMEAKRKKAEDECKE